MAELALPAGAVDQAEDRATADRAALGPALAGVGLAPVEGKAAVQAVAELALPAGVVDLAEDRALADRAAPALAEIGWAWAEEKSAAPAALVAQLRVVGVGLRVALIQASPAANRPVGQLALGAAGVALDLALKPVAENLAQQEQVAAGAAAPEKAAEVTQAAEIGAQAHLVEPDQAAQVDQALDPAVVQAAAKVVVLALEAAEGKEAAHPRSPMK